MPQPELLKRFQSLDGAVSVLCDAAGSISIVTDPATLPQPAFMRA